MDPTLAYDSLYKPMTHTCWAGGEPVSGFVAYYICKEHDVMWTHMAPAGYYPDFDPDFAATAPSPA